MLLLSDMLNSVRKNSVEWHCHEIVISQDGLKNGFIAHGYGVIRSDEGILCLDFICLKTSSRIEPRSTLPEDILDKSQMLTMTAKRIDGVNILSEGLVLEGSFYSYIQQGPKVFSTELGSIEISERCKIVDDNDSLIRLEFKDRPNIPFNVVNSIKSTLGTRSSSWNETKLTYLSSDIRVIDHNSYTEVIIKGPCKEIHTIRKAVVFYINFSTGLYVQPYFERLEELGLAKTTIYSIDASKINFTISAPLSGKVFDENKKTNYDQNHLDLFSEICELITKNPEYFRSISSQWHRIWHSFLSYEVNVPMLSVSVAVEGVLSDIFMPVISEALRDESFEKEKKMICSLIENIEELSEQNISQINSCVKRWGNINPKKALSYLREEGVIEKYHVDNWVSLRNSAAHPKLIKQDEIRKRKNLDRMYICLGLFYRLVLNILAYTGPRFAFENSYENKLILQEHVQVLK